MARQRDGREVDPGEELRGMTERVRASFVDEDLMVNSDEHPPQPPDERDEATTDPDGQPVLLEPFEHLDEPADLL